MIQLVESPTVLESEERRQPLGLATQLVTRLNTDQVRYCHWKSNQSLLEALAGVGDLILTCTENLSRNRRLGLALGEGIALKIAVQEIGQVVEGFNTAREVVELAHHYKVDMPISEQVYRVLHDGLPPARAVHNLLARSLKPEAL